MHVFEKISKGTKMALDSRLKSINKLALSDLKTAYKEKKLTIIVGAGSSAQSGIPTWNRALEELLISYIESKYSASPHNLNSNEIHDYVSYALGGQSPITFAQVIKSDLSEDEYLDMVHDSLYGNLPTPPVAGDIANAVSKLHLGLQSVITFNYDEMLEQAFTRNNIKNSSVWNSSSLSNISGIPIYHPHGFLPYKRQADQDYWIVFSEDEYHSQYYSSMGWSNIALANALYENTCLFVSNSISDPNLRRIIDSVHRESPDKKNYFIWSTPEIGSLPELEEKLNNVYEDIFTESFSRLGLHPLWFFNSNGRQRWSDIPDLLGEILLP